MTDRGNRKRIGDGGEAVVKAIVQTHGGWIARDTQHDVGIDLEAELDEPQAYGQFLKLQIKTTRRAPPHNGVDTVRVKSTFVRYASECRLPIILVRLWLPSQRASYAWMQEWIEQTSPTIGSITTPPETIAVNVEHDFRTGLDDRLKSIARGATPLQFRLTLRDAARWAVVHRNADAVAKLGELLGTIGNGQDAPVDVLIDEMISYSQLADPGPVRLRAIHEFNRLMPVQMEVCRRFAFQFSRTQVERLIVRGDSFSRGAMYGLAALYDTAPEHMASLDLPAAFDRRKQYFLAFYCRLRERYPGIPSLHLILGNEPLEAPGGAVHRPDGLLNAYANRGDSALFDYFEPDDALRELLKSDP